MSRKLPPEASVAEPVSGDKLFAPSAASNLPALLDVLLAEAPPRGRALEIASGTGQHVTAFAAALPGLDWQPSEIAPERLASIDAHATEAKLPNLRPAVRLDATRPGWHEAHSGFDLIVIVNLLHLISETEMATVLAEAARALGSGGRLILYGPFKRSGALTSPGDERFDAALRCSDPAIGYKSDDRVAQQLTEYGLGAVKHIGMPANNLVLVAGKT